MHCTIARAGEVSSEPLLLQHDGGTQGGGTRQAMIVPLPIGRAPAASRSPDPAPSQPAIPIHGPWAAIRACLLPRAAPSCWAPRTPIPLAGRPPTRRPARKISAKSFAVPCAVGARHEPGKSSSRPKGNHARVSRDTGGAGVHDHPLPMIVGWW